MKLSPYDLRQFVDLLTSKSTSIAIAAYFAQEYVMYAE